MLKKTRRGSKRDSSYEQEEEGKFASSVTGLSE
jgi:hypothetical protein